MSESLSLARAAPPAPAHWIDALRTACAESTQAKVARRIGYSGAAVSQVLSGKYTGNLAAVEQAVRGALMDVRVDCPRLGLIAANICTSHQRSDFAATTPQRVALYRACRGGCPHYQSGAGRPDQSPRAKREG